VFDIGTGELIALAVLALLILGPEKLPQYAQEAARFIRQLRSLANEARTEVTRELGPELDGLDLRDLNPRSLVRKHLLDPLDDDDDDDDDDDLGSRPTRKQQSPRHRSESSSAEAPYDPDTT
jgi:sec-independent protein translocase protein TatB